MNLMILMPSLQSLYMPLYKQLISVALVGQKERVTLANCDAIGHLLYLAHGVKGQGHQGARISFKNTW